MEEENKKRKEKLCMWSTAQHTIFFYFLLSCKKVSDWEPTWHVISPHNLSLEAYAKV